MPNKTRYNFLPIRLANMEKMDTQLEQTTDISLKMIHKWSVSVWKDAQ